MPYLSLDILNGGLSQDLLTSAVSFALGLAAKTVRDKVQSRRKKSQLEKRLERGNPGATATWITDYYERRGRGTELYECHSLFPGHKLQFLVRPSWIFDRPDDGSLIEQQVPQRVIAAGIDKRALRSRGHATRSLTGEDWNDFHSCVISVSESPNGPQIRAGLCRYLEYLSVSGGLEDETFRAMRSRRRSTPLRDEGFCSVEIASSAGLGVHSIGMVTALIYMDDGVPMTLIQRRSQDVSTYSGALGVVPMFSCQTRDLSPNTEISLTNNFLRELYEELYGGIEAISASATRASKDWYESVEELSRYVTQEARDRFRIVGFGFDARNAQLIIGSIFMVEDEDFSRIEVPRMRGNWEIANIDILPLRGIALQEFLLEDRFTPACSFTLMRALELLS